MIFINNRVSAANRNGVSGGQQRYKHLGLFDLRPNVRLYIVYLNEEKMYQTDSPVQTENIPVDF